MGGFCVSATGRCFLFGNRGNFTTFGRQSRQKVNAATRPRLAPRSQALRICVHGVPVGRSRTKSALDGRILCFRASACFTRRCFVLSYQYEKRAPSSIRCARFCYAFPSINRRSFSGVMPVCSAPSHLMHGPSPHLLHAARHLDSGIPACRGAARRARRRSCWANAASLRRFAQVLPPQSSQRVPRPLRS